MKLDDNKIFLYSVGVIFAGLLILFLFFPRSTVSELERRELAKFPDFSFDRLADGSFTSDVSAWFSDTEPFRDKFMEAHHSFRQKLALNVSGEDNIVFHAATTAVPDSPEVDSDDDKAEEDANESIDNNADAAAKIAHAGIIVIGEPGEARALMAFGGTDTGRSSFAEALNFVKNELGPAVNVYSMIIPTAIEFYCPEKVKGHTKSQSACMNNIYSQLSPEIRIVDSHSALAAHTDEPIYLRTDHHWAPLGAYYVAEQLAKTAGVPFRDLSQYNKGVTHNFVGTMYAYSQDITVKQSPEDFVYYIPVDQNYTTWFTDYTLDSDFHTLSQHGPYKGRFFSPHKDGSGGAYSTMIGSDARTVKVETGTPGSRKALIIKDSFGNAVPGFLFGSFAEVHVIDFRYFPQSLKKYIVDNGITDLVYCVNIFNAYSGSVAAKFRRLIKGTGFFNGPGPDAAPEGTVNIQSENDVVADSVCSDVIQSPDTTATTVVETPVEDPTEPESNKPETTEPAAEKQFEKR